MRRRCSKTDSALLIGICLLVSLISLLTDLLPIGRDNELENLPSSELRRNLQQKGGRTKLRRRPSRRMLTNAEDGALHPWAQKNLRSVTDAPDPENETALFWHIPKSGGSTVKQTYECLDLVLASRAGGLKRFGHLDDEEIVVFRLNPGRGRFVNVDTTSYAGIDRAARLGLVPSGLADVIVTSHPDYAIDHLYDERHRGRALGLFRHPVNRLVSKFYYLQVADWESTYSPELKDMTLDHWAKNVNRDNNSYVRKLASKKPRDQLTEEHLQMAINTLKEKFVVGLIDEMEESIRRFNVFLGVDNVPPKCTGIHANSNSHPKLKEEDSTWKTIAELNSWDIRLWKHVVQMFGEQKAIIDSHSNTVDQEE